MKVAIQNLEGKKVGDIELAESVFGLPKNDNLVHQVYVSMASNQRRPLAHTKTRGERAGSGVKPWRQKGTGRARVGSVRTPVWRGGGIIFGPRKERNFKKKINKKMRALATATVLSGKLRDGELKIIDSIKLLENKTRQMATTLKNLKLKGNILMVFSEKEREWMRSSRNISQVSNVPVNQLNVLLMLNNKNLILSRDSAGYLERKYISAGKPSKK